jgi:hypothetical protein
VLRSEGIEWLYERLTTGAAFMNPTRHMPIEVRLRPSLYGESAAPIENIFVLELVYKPNGFPQTYLPTYIPPALQVPLQTAGVRSIHLETLELHSDMEGALPYPPRYVVLAVELADGSTHTEVPAEWLRLRRKLEFTGTILLLTAAGLLAKDLGVVMNCISAGLLALGVLKLRAASAVPRLPLKAGTTLGNYSADAVTSNP